MVDSTGGGMVLFLGGIDRVSPRCDVSFRHLSLASIRWFDAALRCCGSRRCVERGAHVGSLVVSRALWVLPLRGPCWTRNAQVHEVNGGWGAQGCGVLTWECAGSLAGGNISSFYPPGWVRAAFFCACVYRGSGWPSGESGGASKVPYQGATPLQVRGTSAGRNKSREGDGFR